MKVETFQLLALMLFVAGHRFSKGCEYQRKLNLDLSGENTMTQLIKFLQSQNDSITSIDTVVIKDKPSTTTPTTTSLSTTTGYNLTSPSPQSTNGSACNISRFTFKNASHLDYVRYEGSIPNMTSFTFCFWIRLTDDTDEKMAIVSYCVSGDPDCNTFVVWLENERVIVNYNLKKSVGDFSYENSNGITNRYMYRTHICIVKSKDSLSLRINASEHTCQNTLTAPLEGGGVLILGQNLDGRRHGESSLTPWHSEQGFRGDVEGFQLWNDSLSCDEIGALYQFGELDSSVDAELIITLNKSNSVVMGDVIADWSAPCPKPYSTTAIDCKYSYNTNISNWKQSNKPGFWDGF